MSLQNYILDRLVLRVKQNDFFRGALFIHSNNMTPAQQPVSKFTVCCLVEKSRLTDKFLRDPGSVQPVFLCESEFLFTVYAPKNADGRTLSVFAQRLSDELAFADSEGVIRSSGVSRPYFDRDVTAMRCEVTVKASFMCGKAVAG